MYVVQADTWHIIIHPMKITEYVWLNFKEYISSSQNIFVQFVATWPPTDTWHVIIQPSPDPNKPSKSHISFSSTDISFKVYFSCIVKCISEILQTIFIKFSIDPKTANLSPSHQLVSLWSHLKKLIKSGWVEEFVPAKPTNFLIKSIEGCWIGIEVLAQISNFPSI